MDIQLGDVVVLTEQSKWSLHLVLQEMPKDHSNHPTKFRLMPLGGTPFGDELVYYEDELFVVGGIRFNPQGLYILTRDYKAENVFLPAGTVVSIDTGRVEPLMVCSPVLLPREGVHYSFVADRMVPALDIVFDHFSK